MCILLSLFSHWQVCLATVLAQVGAVVPAAQMSLVPADAIFVRMGAKDNILSSQSTFLVELAETAAVLHRATPRSLVALDELGRGTAYAQLSRPGIGIGIGLSGLSGLGLGHIV